MSMTTIKAEQLRASIAREPSTLTYTVSGTTPVNVSAQCLRGAITYKQLTAAAGIDLRAAISATVVAADIAALPVIGQLVTIDGDQMRVAMIERASDLVATKLILQPRFAGADSKPREYR